MIVIEGIVEVFSQSKQSTAILLIRTDTGLKISSLVQPGMSHSTTACNKDTDLFNKDKPIKVTD